MHLSSRNNLLLVLFVLVGLNASGAGPVFNVLDYGAHRDGSTNSTEAFRSAIQAAKAAGGGTVFVPAGNYVTGPIELVSDLVLQIDAGATLRFPAAKLPFTKGRQQGIECLTPVPLIGGHDLHNVTVTGRGLLTTDNAEWLKLMPRTKATKDDPGTANGPNWERLLQDLEVKTPAPDEDYQKAAPELRPSFIRFMDCTNVLVEGIHFVGSSMWTIHLLYSDNAVVQNVIIETYPGVHTDGIAVDSSRNVRISNCYIDTGDDGIVIKSGKDADGRRVNRPTENVSIANCTVHHAHGAVALGSEISGGIRNVVADNITCKETAIGVRIKSRRGRGGSVEDVRFNNWTMENVGEAINVTTDYQMEGEVKTCGGTGLGADAGVSQHRHQRHDHQRREAGDRHRRIAGDADFRTAHQRRHRVGQKRPARLLHRGAGTAQRAGERGQRAGLSDAGFEGIGTGRCGHAQAAGGCARDPAGTLSRRHRAEQPGVRRHRHVSFRSGRRVEESRAGRQRARCGEATDGRGGVAFKQRHPQSGKSHSLAAEKAAALVLVY